VRFLALNVQDFRNLPLARMRMGEGPLFLLGGNGRGKTSVLEALSLASALRSFRTNDARTMIRHGAHVAKIYCEIEHEREGRLTVEIALMGGGKTVSVDGNPLPRVSELVGRYPTVPLSSQDIQLVRSGPSVRRRFMDMMLAEADKASFDALRRYGKALQGRTALLKTGSAPEIAAFEKPLADAAAELVAARKNAVAELLPLFRETYAGIAPENEVPEFIYKPDTALETSDAFAQRFAANRGRDILRGISTSGPHLDDYEIRLGGKSAKEYASEGQQRGLVLALRLAQARWLKARTGILPVILADDIMGELDPVRRAAFWSNLGREAQVIATGTEIPAAEKEDPRFNIVAIETLLAKEETAPAGNPS
jgi:DNA replication and repair protein RecF